VYIHKDRKVTEKDLRRVKELGYKGVMVTVDAPVVGKRERDERVTIFTEESEEGSYAKAAAGSRGLAKSTSSYFDIKLIWHDLFWLRSVLGPDMPIAVKGIQTAEDAALCASIGAHVYVSNHGGRQLDGAPTSIETLLEMRRHCPWVFDKVEVYVDGGYRRGTDVVKAIALGARAILLGRPFLFSLAFGQDGAEKTIEILNGEIVTAMRLLGVTRLDELGPQHINATELERNVSKRYDGISKPWFGGYFGAKL
jgi:L-lactate dehydrogenase (cytochrome)